MTGISTDGGTEVYPSLCRRPLTVPSRRSLAANQPMSSESLFSLRLQGPFVLPLPAPALTLPSSLQPRWKPTTPLHSLYVIEFYTANVRPMAKGCQHPGIQNHQTVAFPNPPGTAGWASWGPGHGGLV